MWKCKYTNTIGRKIEKVYETTITHSAASSLWILKYLSSYWFLFVATTLRYSFKSCFLRYFLVKYFKYLLLKGTVDCTLMFDESLLTVTELPKLPGLPSTLILCLRKFSKSFKTMTLSSMGSLQLIWYLRLIFLACLWPFLKIYLPIFRFNIYNNK